MSFEYLKDFPTEKYNTIVIDPPYNISMTGEVKRREKRAKKLNYKTLSLEEIKNIPIGSICNIGAHVYLWTTNKYLKESFDIFKKWDINFHLVLVMVKPSGIAPCMGYVFGTEFCLLGFYKKPMQKFKKIGVLNWFQNFNKKGSHSVKPDIFYNMLEQISNPPYIDIFSRKRRENWSVWGDEV